MVDLVPSRPVEWVGLFLLAFSLLPFLVSLLNLATADRLRRRGAAVAGRISVLVPVRDEAANLRELLPVLETLSPSATEILVLDDGSSDEGANLVRAASLRHPRIRLLEGAPLPTGWRGKPWACHQLSLAAAGDHLLFIDADVRLAPEAPDRALALMRKRTCGLLSVFPTQRTVTWGEKLVTPLLTWIVLSLLPVRLVRASSWRSFNAANGQFMLFDRASYDRLGGHAAVGAEVVEDLALARLAKRKGVRNAAALGDRLVSCRMYGGFREAWNGFSKNFAPGTGLPAPVFLPVLVTLFLLFILPFLTLPWGPSFLAASLLLLLSRAFTALAARRPVLEAALLHVPQMFVLLGLGLRSLLRSGRGVLTWKGRPV